MSVFLFWVSCILYLNFICPFIGKTEAALGQQVGALSKGDYLRTMCIIFVWLMRGTLESRPLSLSADTHPTTLTWMNEKLRKNTEISLVMGGQVWALI